MPWLSLILFVASFFVSQLLAPKPEIENAKAGKFDPGSFPRIDGGSPIPYIFGRVRLRAPNVLWYGNFAAIPNKKKVKTNPVNSDEIIVSYTYQLGLDIALCLGPGVVLRRIWMERKLLFASVGGVTGGTVFSVTNPYVFGGPERGGGFSGSLAFYSGEFTQARDTYEQAQIGATVPAYVGVARLVIRGATWGTQPTLRPISVEVERYPNNLGLASSRVPATTGADLNPMEILYSVLTEEWGGAARSAAEIDVPSFTDAAATLLAEGHGMSIVVSSAQRASEVCSEIMRQTDALLFQEPDTGKISVKLVRADYTVGSLPLFDESNIKLIQNWSRTGWVETWNQARVAFTDRSRLYEQSTALAQDHANIAAQATIRNTSFNYPGVTTAALAQKIAARELSQLSVPLFRATIVATRAATVLTPGAVFRMRWSRWSLVDIVMRVQKFDGGELIDGRVVMDVMQDKFSTTNPLFGDPEISLWAPIDHAAPTLTNKNVFESPWLVITKASADEYLVWNGTTFVISPNSSWLTALARPPITSVTDRYDLVTSTDSFTVDVTTERDQKPYPPSYSIVPNLWWWQGQEDGILTQLVIESAYATTGLDITIGPGAAAIRTGDYMAVIDGEFLYWESATDIGGGQFRLNNVRRALLDTQFETHVAGATLFLITRPNWLSRNAHGDTSSFEYKLLSYTDADAQDITMVPTTPVTMDNRYDRPLPPDFLQTHAIRTPAEILEQTTIPCVIRTRRRYAGTIPEPLAPLYNDGGSGYEASTTSTFRFYLDGLLYVVNSGVAGVGATVSSTLTIPGGMVGTGRVEALASLTGLLSYKPDFVEFWWGSYPSLSAELITTPNFEGSTAGWTTISGSWGTETTAYPLDALRFYPGFTTNTRHLRATASSSELRQDYTIGGAVLGRSALLSFYRGGKIAGVTGQIIVELRNGGGLLKSISQPLAAPTLGKWERGEIPLPLRTDATIVRVRVMGTSAESVWDQISLRANTVATNTPFSYNSLGTVTSVKGAWGLRKMLTTTSGALVRILDTFDDSEQDVGFDPDGNLEPFYVRGEARVVKLYDQSGGGSHLAPPTAADRPRLVSMLTETGRPGIRFDATSGGGLLEDITTHNTNLVYMILRPNMMIAFGPASDATTTTVPTAGGTNAHIVSIPQNDTTHTSPFFRAGLQTGGNDWRPYLNGAITNTITNAPAPNLLGSKHAWYIDYSNGGHYHNSDAATVATFAGADVTYPVATRLRIGRTPPGQNNQWSGALFEFAIIEGNVSAADRKTMIEGIGTYWYNAAY